MNNPKLYTVKEAAKIVGVSTNTLYKYLDEDRIHAARGSAIQGRFRIPEAALEEFLGVKLSTPEPDPQIAEVNDSQTPEVSALNEAQTVQDVPVTMSSDTVTRSSTRLPLRLARFLLILALVAILIDLFIAKSVSLPAVASRLFVVLIMILLSYQEGGYRRS